MGQNPEILSRLLFQIIFKLSLIYQKHRYLHFELKNSATGGSEMIIVERTTLITWGKIVMNVLLCKLCPPAGHLEGVWGNQVSKKARAPIGWYRRMWINRRGGAGRTILRGSLAPPHHFALPLRKAHASLSGHRIGNTLPYSTQRISNFWAKFFFEF